MRLPEVYDAVEHLVLDEDADVLKVHENRDEQDESEAHVATLKVDNVLIARPETLVDAVDGAILEGFLICGIWHST